MESRTADLSERALWRCAPTSTVVTYEFALRTGSLQYPASLVNPQRVLPIPLLYVWSSTQRLSELPRNTVSMTV